MKNPAITLLLFCVTLSLFAQQAPIEFPKLTGPYLGQTLPGKTPEPFAENVFNERYERFHTMITFSPDGKEAYWQAREKSALPGGQKQEGIFMSKTENGQWSVPTLAPFSILNNNDDAATFSPDGKRLFFLSTRPVGPGGKSGDETIWYADKTDEGWKKPVALPSVINSMRLIHWGVSVDNKYNLYFGVRPTMDLRDGYNGDIYCSKFINGQYTTPEKLPAEVNIQGYKFSPYISPDGSFLLFTQTGSNDDHYKIMISFREKDGGWTKAVEINEMISLSNLDIINPYVTPDGKYFFFSRIISGRYPKPYWVDASFIKELKQKE